MRTLNFLAALLISTNAVAANEICLSWFKSANLKSGASDCELKCASTKVDMGTFFCTDQCEEICNLKAKCSRDAAKYLDAKFSNNRHPRWPNGKEKTKKWSQLERAQLVKAIEKIPKVLWPETLESIQRMDKSIQTGNPSVSIVEINSTALFDNAFGSLPRLSRILAHEFAHFYYEEMGEERKASYRFATRWRLPKDKKEGLFFPRDGKFVESDGALGPDEDFANNLEYFIFDRPRLLSATPFASQWLSQRFGANLISGGDCETANP